MSDGAATHDVDPGAAPVSRRVAPLPWWFHVVLVVGVAALLWGTSTPQYMMHPECFGSIKRALPGVKIIVTLRDPVRRLVSHFDMATRLGATFVPLVFSAFGHLPETTLNFLTSLSPPASGISASGPRVLVA